MGVVVRPELDTLHRAPAKVAAAPVVPSPALERHGYAPPPGRRPIALGGSLLIFGLVAAAIFVTFEHRFTPPPPSVPLAMTLMPATSPPETPPKPKVAPKPVERHERTPTPPRITPQQRPVIPIPTISAPPPEPAAKPVDLTPPQPQTAAPKTAPAPPAPQVASNAPDTWEGRVLARLQKYQRYPGAARAAGQQGVVYIRFRINRDGHVLSSALAKSSGFPTLDQAALDTLRRADPLPKIPPDRPDEIELSVPVEFYIR